MSTPLRERPDAPLGTLIFRAGLLPAETIESALEEGVKTGKRLGEILTERGLISEVDLARLLAGQKGLDFVTLREQIVDPTAAALFTEEQARLFRALPYSFDGDLPVVAIADPTDEVLMRNIREALGRDDPRFVVCARGELADIAADVYSRPLPAAAASPDPVPVPEPDAAVEPAVEPGAEAPAEHLNGAHADAELLMPVPPPALEPEATAQAEQEPEPEPLRLEPEPMAVPEPPAFAVPLPDEPDAQEPVVPEPAAPKPEPLPAALAEPLPAPAAEPAPPAVPAPPVTPEPVAFEPDAPAAEPSFERAPDPEPEALPENAAPPAPEPLRVAEPSPAPALEPAAAPEPAAAADPVPLPQPPAPPPAPYPPAASQPEPAPEVPAAPPAVASPWQLTIRLTTGERVEGGDFADEESAKQAARTVMAAIADADSAEWPFVNGRFLKPDTIVSVDIGELGAESPA